MPKRNSDNVSCNQSFIHKSEREDEAPSPETEHSAVMISNVKTAVLHGDTITSNKEEPHPIKTTAVPPVDTELPSSVLHSADHKPEKENCNLLQTANLMAEHAEMNSDTNVDVLMLEDMPSSDVCHGDMVNDLCQLNKHQSLDQMVPAYYEPTTAVSQGNSNEKVLKGKTDQNGMEKCLTSSATVCPPDDKNENQTEVRENITHTPAPKMASTRKMEGSHQEEAQPLDTGNVSIIYMDKDTTGRGEVDQTVMCMKSEAVTDQEPCKSVASNNHLVLSTSKQAPGCSSSFGSEGDILEFDCVMDCTDSQLVHLPDQLPDHKLDTRQQNNSKMPGSSKVPESSKGKAGVCSADVPSDNGMVKGLISELSALNKFIMGAWKDLEHQRKQRQARLKSGKGKKLK